DAGWLLGWALLLLTLVPFQAITTWLQGLFAIGLGGVVKRRLLCGAMKLFPEEMRKGGIGSFLGQALEAEAVESLALSGGIAGLLATVEIVLAMFVLGRFALVLAFWTLLTALAAWQFSRAFARWTDVRMVMTEDLVEAMVGHRTRVAQLPRKEWHETEDQALHGYLTVSKSLDNTGAWLIAAVPRGWLVAGLACLLPAIGVRHAANTKIELTLGGVLVAYSALRKLTGSFADLAIARVAFRRIKPLFQAAARQEKLGETLVPRDHQSLKVIEADRLSYRYRATGKAALQAGDLIVRKGDRILLEGPSGGGKTTFVSLLSGMREPESGLLLSNGLDRTTLGSSEWRKRIVAAPQFHENHILTETLAFNLLLGRRWPPKQVDMEEAEIVCRELGLGDLLDSMPSGLMQMVGEGGWQLSHGERSRVFIARALLQSADLVILDESFAALDPENVTLALQATIERATTLMVIAHP
ncbi:MAG: ATP-binding cassette domain-containing protein, partial [Acidobacteriaceae bacterium]|nr:ATP-binding cassette domain-containing protein [Acidobacteriaceae bacterium]